MAKVKIGFTLAEGGRSPLLCRYEGAQGSPRLIKRGFTLAEVLITLGVIGVVAAATLSSIKHIRYAGYAEKFLKTYSEIQQAHVSIVQKYGDPQNWTFTQRGVDTDDSGNAQIAKWFMDEFNATKKCIPSWDANECHGPILDEKYIPKYLNSTAVPYLQFGEYAQYSMVLSDGRYISIGFGECYNNRFWQYPKMFFMVDVNGRFKKPNQLGRDIFFIAFEQNEQKKYVIRPFSKTYDSGLPMEADCNLEGYGHTCGNRILLEKGMKY